MTPQAENHRFNDLTYWRVDRSTPFRQLVYTDSIGQDQFYRPNEAPKSISDALLSSDGAGEVESNPLDECVEIPPQVYDLLPTQYRHLCDLYDTLHEKHVFLCGMLPTIASLLPNVQGAHADGFYSPDVFLALVATAGQGKGTAAKAFDLASPVDEMLRHQSEVERLDYEAREKALEKGESMNEVQPPEKCHIVPANASAIALIQSLHDNDGRAFLAETEIDSMLAADKNAEWGNVSSILRGAFHHEAVSVKRKTAYRGKTTLSIKHPCLSVFLSGTPSQFQELMHSTENGLFSRFAVYYHNPPLTWRSHRPTAKSTGRGDAIRTESEILKTVYELLTRRNAAFPPLSVELSHEQWNDIDLAFSVMQDEFFHEEQRPDLLPSARRGAIVAFRLAIQFAVFRWIEANGLQGFAVLCQEESAVIEASDADVECAVLLAKTFTHHAHKLSSLLPRSTKAISSTKASVMRFLEALPAEFETKDAVSVGEGLGIPERTAKRYLSSLVKSGTISKRVNGKYNIVPNGTSGTNGISGTSGTNKNDKSLENATCAKNATCAIVPNGTKPTKPTADNNAVKEASEFELLAEQWKKENFGTDTPPDYDNSIYDFSTPTNGTAVPKAAKRTHELSEPESIPLPF
ncbi:MAG: DUF3987 domain-containing protein [Candidatus Kapaibacteriota bacterium]